MSLTRCILERLRSTGRVKEVREGVGWLPPPGIKQILINKYF